jgi:hypothetical protein
MEAAYKSLQNILFAATTIVTEAANKIFCKDLSAASISRWADQLVDHQVRLQRSHTFDQIKLMLSETDRLEISQTLKSFRFADGASIKDAANWTKWEDNQGLADILKLVYPKSEAISDVQRIVALQFRIFWVKNARHFLPFVAQAQQALSWEDRLEEFSALSPGCSVHITAGCFPRPSYRKAPRNVCSDKGLRQLYQSESPVQHGGALRRHCGGRRPSSQACAEMRTHEPTVLTF